MTVQDLIALLSDYHPHAEVRLATQPNWPIAHNISAVISDSELSAPAAGGDPDYDADHDGTVWIVEGGQPANPYAPDVWAA